MPKIKKVLDAGTLIYPATIPQAVVDPTTGNKLSDDVTQIKGNLSLAQSAVEDITAKALTKVKQTLTTQEKLRVYENLGLSDVGRATMVVSALPTTDIISGLIYLVQTDTPGTFTQYVREGESWTSLGRVSVEYPTVVDNLVDGGVDAALSADQGLVLDSKIGQLGEIVGQTIDDASSTGTGYYDEYGTRVPSNSFVNWTFRFSSDAKRVRCFVHISTSYPAVLFYGPSGFISAVYTTSGAAQWVESDLPEGTTYLRVVSGEADSDSVIVQIYISGSEVSKKFLAYDSDIENINGLVDNLQSSLTATNDMAFVKRTFTLEPGSVSISTGANSSSSSTVRGNEYLYVGDTYLLRIALSNGYKARVFLYDKDKTFLGSYDWTTDPETVLRFNANFAMNTTVIIPTGQTQTYETMIVKYVRIAFRDSTDSSGVTPASVAENCEVSTASITAHYENPRLKTNGLVLSLAHQGVGVRKGGNAWSSNGNNMLSSIYGAYLAGHDGCLLNTVWTSDGVPVCNHDGYFTDAVSGVTVTISTVTYDELQTHPINASGECVPSLDSALYMCRSFGMKVWLVNMSVTRDKINTVFALVSKYQMRDDVFWMVNAESAGYVLTRYRYAKLAVCQSNISSVDYSEIAGAIEVAGSIVDANDYCTVTVWVSGSHPVENLIQAGGELPERTTLGAYNVSVGDVPKVLPYVKVLSTHSMSVGGLNYQILNWISSQYPEILYYAYGKDLI